jgi:hypothetical protein
MIHKTEWQVFYGIDEQITHFRKNFHKNFRVNPDKA